MGAGPYLGLHFSNHQLHPESVMDYYGKFKWNSMKSKSASLLLDSEFDKHVCNLILNW